MKIKVHCTVVAGVLLLVASGALSAQNVAASNSNPGSVPEASKPADQVRANPTGRTHDNTYVIGDDDLLEIDVWKEPELSKSLQVRSDGKVSLPLVGEVQAAGRTPLQLEQDITERLRAFITEPAVTVMVQKINSLKFNVMGEVNKPGSYPLTTSTTVVDAIATAGGFKDFAKKKTIAILHTNPDGTESRTTFNYVDFTRGKNPYRNVWLRPGDTVLVP